MNDFFWPGSRDIQITSIAVKTIGGREQQTPTYERTRIPAVLVKQRGTCAEFRVGGIGWDNLCEVLLPAMPSVNSLSRGGAIGARQARFKVAFSFSRNDRAHSTQTERESLCE